jgi:hypothetical protein
MVDQATGWAEAAVLVSGTSVCDYAGAFSEAGSVGRGSTSNHDRGSQFTSEVWSSLPRRLRTKHLLTSVYHLQSNGLLEHFHRQLKDMLTASLAGV